MIKIRTARHLVRNKQIDKPLLWLCAATFVALTVFLALLTYLLMRTPANLNTRTHEVGELVTTKKLYSVAVIKATFDNSIAPKLHLPNTERVLVLDVQVKNLSTQSLNYLPIIDTFLRDDEGNTYSFTPGLTDNTMPAQLIAYGKTLRGDLAFVVPSTYAPLWFYFDAKFNNQGPVSFQIVP